MIDLKHFVDLELSTSSENGFYVSDEKQSGEYRRALVLQTSVSNDTLFVTDPLNPTFEFPQDKLSAHKITDTKGVLILPNYKNLFLNLVESNVNISGNYNSIILNIHSGNAVFENISGNVDVISVQADITALQLTNYKFKGSTRNGKLEIENNKHSSKYIFQVETINGDIHLNSQI